jgi:hypothetical protein
MDHRRFCALGGAPGTCTKLCMPFMICRLMLVHLLVYLPGREGPSDDQLGLRMTRN